MTAVSDILVLLRTDLGDAAGELLGDNDVLRALTRAILAVNRDIGRNYQIAVDEIQAGRKQVDDTVIRGIPRDREVIVYCRSGARSNDIIRSLRKLGYSADNLVNMSGGIIGWARSVDESMPVY